MFAGMCVAYVQAMPSVATTVAYDLSSALSKVTHEWLLKMPCALKRKYPRGVKFFKKSSFARPGVCDAHTQLREESPYASTCGK